MATHASAADVRVLAAPAFSATESETETSNPLVVARFTEVGVAARILERPGINTLHNKGIVADDAVVVGSMNGNHHSRSQNREVALIIEGTAVADYYATLFLSDWNPSPPPRDASVVQDDLASVPAAPWPTLFALLLVVVALRR